MLFWLYFKKNSYNYKCIKELQHFFRERFFKIEKPLLDRIFSQLLGLNQKNIVKVILTKLLHLRQVENEETDLWSHFFIHDWLSRISGRDKANKWV